MKPITLLVIAGHETYYEKSYGCQEVFEEGFREGLIDEHRHAEGAAFFAPALTDAGRQLLATCSPDELGGPDGAWNRLWAYLLSRGGVMESYYGSPRPDACVHLAECGLDAAASGTPTDDNWTEFAGTFADNDRVSGMSGKATCRCGLVRDVQVVCEYSELSVTGMIRSVTEDWSSFLNGSAGR